ncbi:MAG TPA: LysR family transcriptional regulator [Gaiellaceae bacterium]|jgi:DNA-binding transcriptional LysR family regulator|nr:LysR family transcriptional regulator [Gaiellaceae bacterium]
MVDRWPGIELRHLAAFRAVAKHRSFHAAAARLGYTQSAISQQVAALERAVGARLVVRPGGPKPVTLTDAGGLLLEHADAIAARIAAAQADLAAFLDGRESMLRIGAYQSVGARIIPALLKRLRRERPNLEVKLTEAAGDVELVSLLETGRLDLAFADLPLPDGPFAAVELLRDPYVLVVEAGSELAAPSRRLTPAEVAQLPLICFRSGRCMERILRRLSDFGVAPAVAFRSDHNETLQGLASAGMGVALMPRLAVDAADPSVALVELGEMLPPRLIALAWNAERKLAPAASEFVELAQGVCRGTARRGPPGAS